MIRLNGSHLFVSTVLAALCGLASTLAYANPGTTSPDPKRVQVKMERDEFMRTHRWDYGSDMWVLRSGVQTPAGVKSRDDIKAERDAFLKMHRWDREQGWVPINGEPRNLSTLSRAEVKAEAAQFARTHRWDVANDTFVHMEPARRRR